MKLEANNVRACEGIESEEGTHLPSSWQASDDIEFGVFCLSILAWFRLTIINCEQIRIDGCCCRAAVLLVVIVIQSRLCRDRVSHVCSQVTSVQCNIFHYLLHAKPLPADVQRVACWGIEGIDVMSSRAAWTKSKTNRSDPKTATMW